MEIIQKPSPNFRVGRSGRKIFAIVDHITAGLMPGTLSWLINPKAQASSHYLVTRLGLIYQLVKEGDTAWHAGNVNKPNWKLYDGTNPNNYTIGIEHECISGGDLTDAQYQATFWLHQQLCAKWNIPVDSDHIIGHCKIDAVNRPNDPGPNFPWTRLFADLKGVKDMKVGMEIPEVKVIMNGKAMDKAIILSVDGKDTTYIPAVALRDRGMTVAWDDSIKTVLID